MKDIHKNPILYFVLIPVIVAVWPILVLAIYLPAAQEKLESDMGYYTEANDIMLEILSVAPERIESVDPNKEKIEFAYYKVVNEIAGLCNISSDNYKLSTHTMIESQGKKTQSASVRLTNVEIGDFSAFLSIIQTRWPNLACNILKLNKQANKPDDWDITIEFRYYY